MSEDNNNAATAAAAAAAAENGDGGGDAGGPRNNINAVFSRVPFPQLNTVTNIELWFTKIENWFTLQGLGVRKESEKYSAVIAYLDAKYLEQMHDLVMNKPAVDPYTTIKKAILAKFAESEMTRLDKLATGIQLGDGRPSHLLSQL